MVFWSGALTYPVYLLHQNLGYVLHSHFIGLLGSALLGMLMTVATVIGLAWGVHHLAERTMGPRMKMMITRKSILVTG